ncbi:MAG TPA: hypothetical protein VIV11_27885, partial [Kofleriaceae bacterium]
MRVVVYLFASLLALPSCSLPNASTTEQALSTFSSTVNSLGPAAFWRLGDTNNNLYDFGPTANDGTYYDVVLGEPGAIGGDPNTSVVFTGKERYGSVPDSDIHSLTRAWDNFQFCLQASGCDEPSWYFSGRYGGEIYGPLWVTEEGYDSNPPQYDGNFYIEDGTGVMDPEGGLDEKLVMQQGLPLGLLNGDMQVRAVWSAANEGRLYPVALVARREDSKNFVRAELQLNEDHSLELRIVLTEDGIDYVLATEVLGEWTGGWWYLRFQFEGVLLRARAWPKGTPQPTGWLANAEYAEP